MNKKLMYDAIENVSIGMWKEGSIVRSTNPDFRSGEYRYAHAKFHGVTPSEFPDVGPYITYEEFQSQIESA